MTEKLVTVTISGPSGIVTLTREGKLNALSVGLLCQLNDALDELDDDDDVRGIIIAGSGRAFSTGVDLAEVLVADSVPNYLKLLKRLRRVTTTMEVLSKPVVAAIHGYCYTGGLELALTCDRRIGTADATFSMSSARIGSVAGFGGTQRLPRVVGPAVARDILMTGRVLNALEAHRIGMIDEIVDEDKHIDAAKAWIEQVAMNAPLGVGLAKLAVTLGMEMSLDGALHLEGLMSTLAATTEDRREGMTAVLEKRAAKFTGR